MGFMLNKVCFVWEIIKLDLIEYFLVLEILFYSST
jgi:hypothetical protein